MSNPSNISALQHIRAAEELLHAASTRDYDHRDVQAAAALAAAHAQTAMALVAIRRPAGLE